MTIQKRVQAVCGTCLFFIYFLLAAGQSFGQNIVISGKIVDASTKEVLPGVSVYIEKRVVGTVSGINGTFRLETNTATPFTLVFSFIGYATETFVIGSSATDMHIEMRPQALVEEEVVVSASRIRESVLKAPISIEKLTFKDFQQQAASDFYEGLYQLKGVDMNVHSLTFQTPNTRGFNGETNLRMNQIVDGVENISPGLSFAAGNIFGVNSMDIESMELVVGASSALYGPGGMNGTLVMNSKNPFNYPGLSVSVKTGVMHVNADYKDSPSPLSELAMRYAHVINDRFAFKITGSYLAAEDWHATDYRDRNDLDNALSTRDNNPGYDGVNVYGDDIVVPVNLRDAAPGIAAGIAESQGILPGTPEYQDLYDNVLSHFPDQLITRSGWVENDLIDYDTRNLKLGGAFHYRVREKVEGIVQANYAKGTAAYTAQNRFSLRDFSILSGKIEFKGPDYFIRTYAIAENAGDSFDAGAAAIQMNETWKSSEDWYTDYFATYAQMALLGNDHKDAHRFARTVADNRDHNGTIFNSSKPAMPMPGDQQFTTLFEEIVSKPTSQGGASVVDYSKLWQIEGMYDFSNVIEWVELLIGASQRVYSINSEGTVFFDEPGSPIGMAQFGMYGQVARGFYGDKLRLTASARYDKNKYFKAVFTPRFSAVQQLDTEGRHVLRASFQTAFRFPSIADQWVNMDVGAFKVIGGLPEIHNHYNFDTEPVYPLSGSNIITDTPVTEDGPFVIPEFRPEEVVSMEVGYKGLFFNRMLYLDTYVFRNKYNGFHATQNLVQNPNTDKEQRYQTVISTDDPVSAYGWAIGADLRLMKGFLVRGNVAGNHLESLEDRAPGYQSRFNTPEIRYNIGVSNPKVIYDMGFNVNFRWQSKFLWESNFGVADIPAYSTLDAAVFYPIPKINCMVKAGGTNILNNYYNTSFGGANVGGLYYLSLVYGQMFK